MTTRLAKHAVFVGHGRSLLWLRLASFLEKRLSLAVVEFNGDSAAGLTTQDRLAAMLDTSSAALLVMTAEDEHSDGSRHARENVIHEVGLFQARLGFERAIVMIEDGCESFSNIAGVTQIHFPKGAIEAAFEEVRRILERERLLPNPDRRSVAVYPMYLSLKNSGLADKAAVFLRILNALPRSVPFAPDEIVQDLLHREALGSTAAAGIALPHSYGRSLSDQIVIPVVVTGGIGWDAKDSQGARILMISLSPYGRSAEGLKFMSKLQRCSREVLLEGGANEPSLPRLLEVLRASLESEYAVQVAPEATIVL